MPKLVTALSEGKRPPTGFEEASLSRTTSWDYWTIISQPMWFLERLGMYLDAEVIAKRVVEAKAKARTKYGNKK